MRILVISQYFYPENFRINQLVESLHDLGHTVVVVTGQPTYPTREQYQGYGPFHPRREEYKGVDVIRVPLLRRAKGRSWELALNYLSFAASAVTLGLPRLQGEFDVCLAWCISPMTIAVPALAYKRQTGTPVVTWVQDLWPESVSAVTGASDTTVVKGLRRLVRWIYRGSDQIWIQSPAYRESVEAHGGNSDIIHYVPNWAEDLYDASRWDGIEPESLPPNSLVFAGNLGRAQALHTLIEAAARTRTTVPEAHWVFVGDGSLHSWLQQEVAQRGLSDHVSLLPRRPAEQMPALLKGAMASLVSLTDDPVFAQTIPSKVQSLLAAGRPILASVSGEAARIVNEAQAGLASPAEDAEALAVNVERLFAMPTAERDAMGSRGQRYFAAHFTQHGVMSHIDDLLHDLP